MIFRKYYLLQILVLDAQLHNHYVHPVSQARNPIKCRYLGGTKIKTIAPISEHIVHTKQYTLCQKPKVLSNLIKLFF